MLLLVGAMVLLTATGSDTPSAHPLTAIGIDATRTATATVETVRHATPPVSTTQTTASPTPTSRATAPSATPTPSPTPMATWHTMGTWSGTSGETLPTIAVLGLVRFDWTCSRTPAVWYFQFSFVTLNTEGIISCQAAPTGSQLIANNTGATSTALTISGNGTMGTWTVTVEERY